MVNGLYMIIPKYSFAYKILCYSILNLFTFAERLSFVMGLQVSNRISQLAINSSYLLLLDSKSTLSIYSICSIPKLLFETTKFDNNFIKFHSLLSSFVIINSYMGQLLRIDTKHSLELNTIANLSMKFNSLLSTVISEQSKLFILSDDYSTLAICNLNTTTIKYVPTLLSKDVKIEKIDIQKNILIFYDCGERVHFWNIDDEKIVTLNEDFMVFRSIGHTLFIYDTREILRSEIQLAIACDTLRFSDDRKYLFGISCQESILLMYRINDGQLLEKLFIENLSPLMETSKDRLVLCCNNKLILISITEKDSSPLKW